MNKIYKIGLLAILLATSCNDDFLEKYPLDEISDATFWKSASDVEMYANQFYATLYDARLAWFNIDNASDNQVPSSRNIYTWNEYNVPATDGGWGKADWLQIRRCNYALDRIAAMTITDAALKTAEAEIRFFKSFHYFEKLKMFGEVPWINSALTPESAELTAPRDTRETVTNNIIADLDFAIANLPENSATDRVTKYAALALKTEVALYEGTFRKYHKVGTGHEALLKLATSAAEQIINSKLFSVYKTGKAENDFFDLFVQYELKGNTEGIMVQRFVTDKRMHNNVRQLGEPQTGYSKDFVDSYLCADGLPIGISPLYQGDATFAAEFVNRDPRMRQSIYHEARPYRIYDNGTVNNKIMPEFLNANCPTSYFIIKGYSPYEKDRLPSTSIIDDFIFRYGKVLLDYAEAKAELGECTQAILDGTINLLRDRVKMPHLTVNVGFTDPNWPQWEEAISPLLNEIRRERRIETSAEGDRWNDIVRWKAGKLLENPKTILGARNPADGKLREIYPGFTARKWNNRLYQYPIPTQELTLNPNLKQNPGWQ
ncbi:RagB/SusD family nutrient uptake outer membrane protein [Sphingobacterium sp. DK4209]|uniref:RagB/SusD family nutrient uptake outer membrane protein n=1 Tax=Sphingobacterium zhuxiongii TaxID=2662364 RepID=A0A5Q0Q6F2_9SPHI|nr:MULTISPECIES: RagB/SusD family nutrient uptake outer membrane protein [unclassified Sphingobacterium]MVZ66212.1 RagB/SusD family nutrient uptake outer membrane protein [Sphingobacterium sp. DK4209]QGA24936.1 RagB/SusD family nutrient uptake outer membrane protein [Sphingobacterium sp. dk4302]